jgi:hypothetical protein
MSRIGERVVEVVREAATDGDDLDEAVDELVDEVSRSLRSGQDPSDQPTQQPAVLRDANKTTSERQAKAGVDGVVFDEATGAGLCPVSGDGCGAETSSSRLLSAADARGPPDSSRDDDSEYEYDDESLTEKVLQDRIETDRSAEALEESRKQVAAGKKTAEAHAQQEAAYRQQVAQAEADRAELDPERVQLIDEVVDGHQALKGHEDAVAAEAQQVAAGTVDAAAHNQKVAAFEADKQELYDKTDELREATGRDAPETVSEDDAGRDGSAAGCGVSGAFAECGSVSKDEAGDEQGDRCVALAGVSGCGVSSGSGDSKASASCDQLLQQRREGREHRVREVRIRVRGLRAEQPRRLTQRRGRLRHQQRIV